MGAAITIFVLLIITAILFNFKNYPQFSVAGIFLLWYNT